MYQILEIVGTSTENYSSAVQNAVDQAEQSGMTVLFVDVIEQRGSVRNGKIHEFQAVVKAGGTVKAG